MNSTNAPRPEFYYLIAHKTHDSSSPAAWYMAKALNRGSTPIFTTSPHQAMRFDDIECARAEIECWPQAAQETMRIEEYVFVAFPSGRPATIEGGFR